VLFYGFDDFQVLQLDAIETLGAIVDADVTVSLTFEPGRMAFAGRARTFQELSPIARVHRALPPRDDYYAPGAREALTHLERSLFEPDVRRVLGDGAVRLLEGGNERSELELVAEQIGRLLAEGVPAEEIALVLRHPEEAGELVAEVLGAAGIPHALEGRVRLADTATGRALVGLLRCVPAAPGERSPGELGDLLAWLRAPGVLEHPELADRLERDGRRSGIGGADAARALWEERHWPVERVDRLRDAGGRRELIERVARELDRLFAAPRRRSATLLDAEQLDEGRALVAGRRALAELAELARLAPELCPASAGELALVLERVDFMSGERAREGAVAVLDPLALRARRVRALFLCGLQEGVFPAPARPPALLGEDERAEVAEASGLRLGEQADGLDAERYLLYAAVSRPTDLLCLSWHVADEDGRASVPSLFLEDICDLFDDRLRASALRRGAAAAEPFPPPDGRMAGPSERFSAGPGRLTDQEVLAGVRERPWSASSLSTWVGCPVRWFVEKLLRGEDLEPTAEPLARGGLAHAVLSETLEGLREQTGSAVLRRSNVGLARELMERSLAENEAHFPLSAAPERRPGVRRRLQADLTRYLEFAAACTEEASERGARAPLEPAHLELAFGFRGEDGEEDGLPALELADGVRLRGRIDRVDVGAGGEALVYDYKSGKAPLPTQWVARGDLQIALYARAVEQLLGLTVVGGFYQPLSGKDLRPRGVIESDVAPEIDCVGRDRRDPEEVSALLEQVTAVALAAAEEAGAGALEPRPPTCAFRGGCEYPTICRCER
jgi:ATP-dependent helicase/DNAse subunit B